MESGYFHINTGGRVEVFNDTGTTSEVVYEERPEPMWKRADRERTQRAANYFPGSRESAIERELWNQVSGKTATDSKFNADIPLNQNRDSAAIAALEAQLFSQINAR